MDDRSLVSAGHRHRLACTGRRRPAPLSDKQSLTDRGGGGGIIAAMADPETRYTRAADGVRIAYQVIEGRDPLILDSPVAGHQFELAETIASWVGYREALRGPNAWVLIDSRGSGLSGRYEGDVTVQDFVLDLEAVAAEFENRPLFVSASGTGVGAAVEFVKLHADRVLGMLLRSPSEAAFHPLLSEVLRQDIEGGLYIAARALYDWDSEDSIAQLVQRWMVRLRQDSFWEAAAAYDSWDLKAGLAALEVPIAIGGAADQREELAELTADLDGVRLDVEEAGPVLNRKLGERHRQLIESWLTASVPSSSRQPTRSVDLEQLTTRQLEVLRLVADGHTNKAIGERLSIAPGTVARHISDILNTTGLTNRTEAARYASELGLLD